MWRIGTNTSLFAKRGRSGSPASLRCDGQFRYFLFFFVGGGGVKFVLKFHISIVLTCEELVLFSKEKKKKSEEFVPNFHKWEESVLNHHTFEESLSNPHICKQISIKSSHVKNWYQNLTRLKELVPNCGSTNLSSMWSLEKIVDENL